MTIPSVPSLPDNAYKLLATLSLILIGYAVYSITEKNKKIDARMEVSEELMDILETNDYNYSNEENLILDKIRILSNHFNIDNPVRISGDSMYLLYDHSITGNNSVILDSIANDFYRLLDKKNRVMAEHNSIIKKVKRYNGYNKYDRIILDTHKYELLCGLVLLLASLVILFIKDDRQENERRLKLKSDLQYSEFCQSCGLYFSAIIKHGSEFDGKRNNYFCSDCYDNSEFKNKEITKEEMYARTLSRFNFKVSWITKYYLRRNLDKCDRWNYKDADEILPPASKEVKS